MTRKLFLGALILLLALPVFAADPPKNDAAMQKEMMEAMMRAGTPGDAHKLLNGMAGTFNAKVSMWMMPGQPPAVSEGTSTTQWILDGRYLETRFDGTFMGQPFRGIGYTGYDNVKKQYWSTWMDNTTTGIMVMTGTTSDGGKSWTWNGSMPDPMTGKETALVEKVSVADTDHATWEMWGPGMDGKNYKMMQIDYTRKK